MFWSSPIFFATSPKACDGVWKDSPSRHSKVKLPASVVAMVIRGIIINCTTNGIGRLYADFQIAWDMYKAISRWNAPLNWQNTASVVGRTLCRMGPRWSCLNCLLSFFCQSFQTNIWDMMFEVQSQEYFCLLSRSYQNWKLSYLNIVRAE